MIKTNEPRMHPKLCFFLCLLVVFLFAPSARKITDVLWWKSCLRDLKGHSWDPADLEIIKKRLVFMCSRANRLLGFAGPLGREKSPKWPPNDSQKEVKMVPKHLQKRCHFLCCFVISLNLSKGAQMTSQGFKSEPKGSPRFPKWAQMPPKAPKMSPNASPSVKK